MSINGPHKDRWDPASSKANPHWARMYAAKRRALDVKLLQEAERAIEAEEASQRPSMSLEEAARIARAFGRPIVKPPA